MPPVDNNQPTQAPAPQASKQPGFWAKLFGKKAAPAVLVAQPTSLTPEPQLNNPTPQDFGSAPATAVGNDVTPPAGADAAVSTLEAAPAVPDVAPAVEVPPSVVSSAETPSLPVESTADQPQTPPAQQPPVPPQQ